METHNSPRASKLRVSHCFINRVAQTCKAARPAVDSGKSHLLVQIHEAPLEVMGQNVVLASAVAVAEEEEEK